MGVNKKMKSEKIIELGYTEPKLINGEWCGLLRFIYTVGLVVGINEYGYKYRYCYHSMKEANEALVNYDDITIAPAGNWIKRKGEGGDLTNPNYEINN